MPADTSGRSQGKPLPFDTYSRFAVGVGYQAALRWRHPSVLPGHLLFGLAQAAPELLPTGVAEDVRQHMRDRIGASAPAREQAVQPLRYSDDAKAVFARARMDAFRGGGQAVGPAHLAVALQAQQDPTCAPFLGGEPDKGPALSPPRSSAVQGPEQLGWITLSDEAPIPYSQQLVTGIKDAIATGKMLPGQRLPTVRQLAETLSLAPGTVAKAYRALDVEGVIETAGSKGTTVALPEPGQGHATTRLTTLSELLRPVAVAAFHMGGSLAELESALHQASEGVFPPSEPTSDAL